MYDQVRHTAQILVQRHWVSFGLDMYTSIIVCCMLKNYGKGTFSKTMIFISIGRVPGRFDKLMYGSILYCSAHQQCECWWLWFSCESKSRPQATFDAVSMCGNANNYSWPVSKSTVQPTAVSIHPVHSSLATWLHCWQSLKNVLHVQHCFLSWLPRF